LRRLQSAFLIHRTPTVVEEVALATVSKPPSTGAVRPVEPAPRSADAGRVPWTYIVECADGSYYVGSTFELERRIWEHNHSDTAGAAYTRRRRPVRLAWAVQYDSVADAFAYEKQIQGWSRRKREALIRGDFDDLPSLSGRRTSSADRWRVDNDADGG
jgi:putative endonuclease